MAALTVTPKMGVTPPSSARLPETFAFCSAPLPVVGPHEALALLHQNPHVLWPSKTLWVLVREYRSDGVLLRTCGRVGAWKGVGL